MKKPLFLIDGYSLIYRSYFAFIRRPLRNPRGRNSSAVFGFFRILFAIFKEYDPKYLAVVMDSRVPTFRHKKYLEYKATREKAPDDLHEQIPVIENILKALSVKSIRKDGYEADDIIATLSGECRREGRECFIVSGDKDLLQLVKGKTRMLKPEKGSYINIGPKEVREIWGVGPDQIHDYLSLVGDSSDNIPGVTGIGAKTAAKLLQQFGSMTSIYENLGNITSKSQREKLENGKENAQLSYELVELQENTPIEAGPEDFSVEKLDVESAAPLFLDEGMKSLVEEFGIQTSKYQVETEKPKPGEYHLVTDEQSLQSWKETVKKAGICAFDAETDSLDSLQARPVGFSIAVKSGEACYIPLQAPDTECLSEDTVKEVLKELFETDSIMVIGQNIKYDYKVLYRWGVQLKNIVFDTMIAAWLLDTTLNSYNMDALAERELGYTTVHYSDIVAKGGRFQDVPIKKATRYAAEDADITFRLYEKYSPMLQDAGLSELMITLEVPLIRVLGNMELEGIQCDAKVLQSYSKEIEGKLAEIEDRIYTECGEIFNINSTKQLQHILFTKRKLTPIRKTKTGYSTDTKVLEELSKEDVVPELILEHRGLSKLKSTYIDALPKIVNQETLRIHTHFIQTGTATGRLSSRDPNLQNIPVKDEDGRRIRNAFIPKKGWKFLSADYSQIELVILAHLSEDPELQKAFSEGIDVHKQTASLLFEKPLEEIEMQERRIAKTINFGIMYGMSGYRLSRELGIPRDKADSFIESYFQKYSGIKDFVDRTVEAAKESGKVSSILGRTRPVPRITSKNKTEQMSAQRIALNTPIQGSAADIVKLAMIELEKRLTQDGFAAKILLQIHDELVIEFPPEEEEALVQTVREIMEGVYSLSVPLRVNIESGSSWGAVH